jgi:hypothetical protein
VIDPLEAAMRKAGVEIHHSTGIKSVACRGDRVYEITLEDETHEWTEAVDELVLAVPPQTLSKLVRQGGGGQPVVKVVPKLAELARLRSQRIPIVHVFFKRKLRKIPIEPVGLYDSDLALAFTDISESWAALGAKTVLSVSASNPYALPGTSPEDDGFAILQGLTEYLEFDPGSGWRDHASPDIDWDRTRYESNDDSQLFINETGIDIWRPVAACDGIENLYFAGNFCANRIGMMTVESAVASGLEAVEAVVGRRGYGAPVQILEPSTKAADLSLFLRYAYGPSAYWAKAWSAGSDCLHYMWKCVSPSPPDA